MFRLLGADNFLSYFRDNRIVYLPGIYGVGKSGLAVMLSYIAVRYGWVKHVISTLPVAWGIDPDYCPPYSFLAIMDEMGQKFDARSFGDRAQNDFRKIILAFPRKVNAYIVISSKVAPDVSFRAMAAQRVFSALSVGIPLERWQWSLTEGQIEADGFFWVWNRPWLWKKDRNNPSAKYGHLPIPGGFSRVTNVFRRAMVGSIQEDGDFHTFQQEYGEATIDNLCRWFGVEQKYSTPELQSPIGGGRRNNKSADNSDGGQSGYTEVLGGLTNEVVSSGKFTLSS